jgi:hypothetical protein
MQFMTNNCTLTPTTVELSYDERPRKMSRHEIETDEINECFLPLRSSITTATTTEIKTGSICTAKNINVISETDGTTEPSSKRTDRKSSLSLKSDHDSSSDTSDSLKSTSTQSSLSPSDQKQDLTKEMTSSYNLNNKIREEELKSLEPNACPSDMTPDTYLHKLFETVMRFTPSIRPTLEVQVPSLCNDETTFILPISEEMIDNYDTDVVTAVRENDLSTIQLMHTNGRSFSCCNRFGESLLHMACRRGYDPIVQYLVNQADVSIRITDDCGRTPLHDALWHKECQYNIVDLLVRTDPLLMLTCDKRGHTPFAYSRREHWANWRQFLWDRREHMKSALNTSEVKLFCNNSSS